MCKNTANPFYFKSRDQVSILTFTFRVCVIQFKWCYLSELSFPKKIMMATLQEYWEGALQTLHYFKKCEGAFPMLSSLSSFYREETRLSWVEPGLRH